MTIDINPPPAEEDNVTVQREYEEDEPESVFYVEKSSRLIYEVKFFPDFVLVRPAHPDFSSVIQRMDAVSFINAFEEYMGDMQHLRDFLWGGDIDSVNVERK